MLHATPLLMSATILATGLVLALPTSHSDRPAQPPAAEVISIRDMPLCGAARRITCVVDGDTFWLHGEKIRIANIDAPEIRGRCEFERATARRATLRLARLLAGVGLSLARQGRDRHGRTLATVSGRSDIGKQLVREGLARPWSGRMEIWCA